jgi:thymidylate synthase (FAD)
MTTDTQTKDSMTNQIKLIALTQGAGELLEKTAQEVISYVARVSNPNNQLNFDTSAGLLKYCIKHEHWSIFEQAYMTLEINTTRAIAAQILRHRSFTYQEFSQRYAASTSLDPIKMPEFRRQDTKNRQNSIDDMDEFEIQRLQLQTQTLFDSATALYQQMLDRGVAKECARNILPLCTPTRIYMTGSCRSWIHYINLRSANGTQKEHMQIAEGCREIFVEQFPEIAAALEW